MFSSPISIDCNSLNALKSNIINDSELHDLAGIVNNGDDMDNIDKYEHEENPEGIVRLSIIEDNEEWTSTTSISIWCSLLDIDSDDFITYFNASGSFTVLHLGISVSLVFYHYLYIYILCNVTRRGDHKEYLSDTIDSNRGRSTIVLSYIHYQFVLFIVNEHESNPQLPNIE